MEPDITLPINAAPTPPAPDGAPKKKNYFLWTLGILVLVIILVASFLILTGKSKLTPIGSLTQSPVLQEQNAVDATNIDISSWKTYSNPGLGISFQYPSNWVLNMDDKNAILTIKADPIVRSPGIEISSIDRKSYVSLDSWLAQENKKCEAGKKLAEETGGDSDCVTYSRIGERKINNFDSPKLLWSCCGSGPTIRYFIEGDPDKIYLIDLFQDWDNFNLNTTGDYDEDNSKLAKIYQQILSSFQVFSKSTTDFEVTSIDNIWNQYSNSKLGFLIQLPKKNLHSTCKDNTANNDAKYKYESVNSFFPVKTFENYNNAGGEVYISVDGYDEYRKDPEGCKKTVVTSESVKEDYSDKGILSDWWKISITNNIEDSEIENFIKTSYGAGCLVENKQELGIKGIFKFEVKGDGIDWRSGSKCPLPEQIVVIYDSTQKRLASWNKGFGAKFFDSDTIMLDDQIVNSLRWQ